MDTLLIRPDSNSGQKNGDRIKESYQSASLPGRRPAGSRKNASLRSRFASATTNCNLERKVAGSIPTDDEVFPAILHFESRDNGENVTCLLSFGCEEHLCKLCENFIDVIICM